MTKNRKTFGMLSRLCCAILLVFLGFAHQPVMAAPDADVAAYILPDGSIPSLCLPDQDGKGGKHVNHGCEACRIASSAAMPMPPIGTEEVVRSASTVIYVRFPERFHRLVFPPSAPPRGPPAILVSLIAA